MLVVDANILIRAVLGSRALFLIRTYVGRVEFFATDTAFHEAREPPSGDSTAASRASAPAMEILGLISRIVQTVELDTYASFELIARQRLLRRDEDDWPVWAAALALRCLIWTQDTDVLGCGVGPGRRIEWSYSLPNSGLRGPRELRWSRRICRNGR
jgi:predicted nucleic acid-binding protein